MKHYKGRIKGAKQKSKKFGKWSIKGKMSDYDFKDDDAFIREIWAQNYDKISKSSNTSYKVFKNRILKNMEDSNLTVEEAVTAVSRTREFMSVEELAFENMQKNLTRTDSTELRKLAGSYRKGWKASFSDDWEWDASQHKYLSKLHAGVALEFVTPGEYQEGKSIIKIVGA